MNAQRFAKLLLLFVLVVLGFSVKAVSATPNRISRGDVTATFNAFTTAGRVILSHDNSSVDNASPANLFDGSIRPFPGSAWDGGHFCVDDWHVLVLALFNGGDQSYTKQEAVSILSPITMDFIIDGVSLATDQTPIKRFLEPEAFGFEKAFGFQEGVIMAPGELGVGEHAFVVVIEDPILGTRQLSIQFFIDSSDSETCTGTD